METRDYWADDFFYPTKKYSSLLQKYCDFFNKIFLAKVVYFSYTRCTIDATFTHVSSHNEICKLLIETKGYQDCPVFTSYDNTKPGFSLLNLNDESLKENINYYSFLELAKDEFSVSNSICITKKDLICCETINLGFTSYKNPTEIPRNEILLQCLNKIDLIDICIDHFKEELANKSKGTVLYRINLKEIKGKLYNAQKNIPFYANNNKKELLLNIGFITEQDLLNIDDLKVQEKICLDYYLEGISLKTIGRKMCRSYRTVYEYIDHIKYKLNIFSRDQLLAKAKILRVIGQ